MSLPELSTKSGPWQGWWIQGSVRGHQRMSLRFGAGKIAGSGSDQSGVFDVDGEYEGTDVLLFKRYSHWTVRYDGRWDGQMISGRWTIREGMFFDTGSFEIWPEEEAIGADELQVEEVATLGA